jgi:hypothetical protein
VAFDIQITNPRRHPNVTPHRVAPLRFVRAVTGFSDAEAPDIDDRGFTVTQFGSANGPVVGLTQGATSRVKLKRDRVESTAQLFATVDDASVASIAFPVAGQPISPIEAPGRQADCVFVQGTSTSVVEQETKLKIHFGSAEGPIMAELAIRVYPLRTIRVQVHLVSVNGVGPETDFPTIQLLFKEIDKIYAQAGVAMILQPTPMNEAVSGFQQAGTVQLSGPRSPLEGLTVMSQNPVPGMLNAYFVRRFNNSTLGIGASRALASRFPPDPATGFPGGQVGLLVKDSADTPLLAQTLAHEIGHTLILEHYSQGEEFNSPPDVRHDMWAHRNLMHNFARLLSTTRPPGNKFKTSKARNQVGYLVFTDGVTPVAGQWLGTKSRARILQSDQVNILRLAIAVGTFMPLP